MSGSSEATSEHSLLGYEYVSNNPSGSERESSIDSPMEEEETNRRGKLAEKSSSLANGQSISSQ